LDVHNVSAYHSITPTLYNGENFPFKVNQFDTGIIVHVLHHCDDGVKVLSEAMRTSRRVILIEDTYRNWIEHKIVSFNDNLGNWEWYQHPYHKTSWWIKTIKQNSWKIIYQQEYSEFTYKVLYGRYVLFVLEK
jgi:SAM-dependent methyltransferase